MNVNLLKNRKDMVIAVVIVIAIAAIIVSLLLTVTAAAGTEITAFEGETNLGTKTVEQGAAKDKLGLPKTLNVTLSDGTQTSIEVTWSGYDLDIPGSYITTPSIKGYTSSVPLPYYVVSVKTPDEDVTEPCPDETLKAVTENGVTVTMTIPAGAFDVPVVELKLSAKEIEDETAKELLEQESSVNDGENVKRKTMLFDINVMHGDEIVQPKKPVQVSFSGIETPKDDAQVFHVDTDAEAVEEMTVTQEENGDITMEVPHFSIYGVTFTVDFHNGDITYSIVGESEVMLSTIFEKLNIKRSIADVISVEFSDPTLIAVEKDGKDWKLTSLKSFETEETLTITFKDGEDYKIRVTDPPYVNGIPVLTPTNKVALINETTNVVTYYSTLDAAMQYIGPGIAGTSYTVVFTQDYASTRADWNAVASNGAQAQKITFTSTYNDGLKDVRSSLTMLNTTQAAHNLSTETEFKNISFTHGSTQPRIYARGHKLTMGDGIINSVDGDHGLQLYGGSPTANVTSSDITVLSGSYAYIFAGGQSKAVTHSSNVFIGGTTGVVYVIPSSLSIQTPASSRNNLTLDGSNGAKVENIYGTYKAIVSASNSAVSAGATINTTIRNMKDIGIVDLYTSTSATGKLTIEGDVQVQNKLWTNKNLTDVELAVDATLTVGSNSDESVAGTGAYSGAFYTGRDLIINSNSKLIFSGDNTEKVIIRNLKVQGAGAEIDIFKSGTTTSPLTIRGTGAYVGTQQLKLNIHKDPKTAGTQDACLSDVLLSFNTVNNAKTENYMAGTDVDGILKNGGTITVDKFLDDPIDVGIGWVNVGVTNPYHDASDPASGKTCTIQYVGGSDKPYARDKKVAPSYTLTGTNNDDCSHSDACTNNDDHSPNAVCTYNDDYKTWPISRGKVTVAKNTTVELILDNVSMSAAQTKAFEVSYANTTFTLKDGSVNNFKVLYASNDIRKNEYGDETLKSHFGGIIGKNGMSGTLTMRCEHSNEPGHRCLKNGTCGVFNGDATNAKHAPVIGSYLRRYTPNLHLNDGGFSNLYIEGGIYDLKASTHNAAIGTTCFLWSGSSPSTNITLLNGETVALKSPSGSPAARGEMCKNINISKARISATCDTRCAPGIGAGYGGMVDGITISDGAYVYAKGGDYAPGIGSGSANTTSHPEISKYAFHVKDIRVIGGDTVVEAIGGKGLADQGVKGSVYMPGIGVGGSNQRPGYHAAGDFTNAYAEPEAGYSVIIKQGTVVDPTQAVYIDGSPSTGRLDVKVNQPYTLIFFSKIGKTASVNGEPDDAGSPDAPVAVNEGDEVRYKIDLGSVVENNNTVTGTVSDSLPVGMTLVETPGAFTPGMTWSTDSTGVTTVTWINQTFTATNKDFYFTVSVDNLPTGVIARDYINKTAKATFVSNGNTVTIPAGITYHHLDKDPGVEFVKVNESGEPISGAGFTIFECTNTSQGHVHTDGTCTWDAAKPLKTEVVSGTDGKVAFTGFSLNKQYIMVETTVPTGMKDPGTNSYIVVNVAADGTYTMTGVGYFAENGAITQEQGGTYIIQNAYGIAEIRLKKIISNYADFGDALKDNEFIFHLSGDVIVSTSLKHGETSKKILHIVDGASDTFNVMEVVPMEFDKNYTVSTSITHADGTTETQTGRTVEIRPGDNALVTITNTYEHKGYFKAWDWVKNIFAG